MLVCRHSFIKMTTGYNSLTTYINREVTTEHVSLLPSVRVAILFVVVHTFEQLSTVHGLENVSAIVPSR